MFLFFLGCQEPRECHNVHPVLKECDYRSPAYQKVLNQVLENLPENSVKYYIEEYYIKDNSEYSLLLLKSKKELCAKASFKIKPGIFLANIRHTKGLGYKGAELKGLRFESKPKADTMMNLITEVKSIMD